MSDEPGTLRDYVVSIAVGDLGWQERARCAGISISAIKMFTCREEDRFVHNDEEATGLQVQKYVVETFCLECPVQWECARFACDQEEPIGVWGMTLRDRNWLMKQRNPAGIIDLARREKMAVSVAVQLRRSEMQRHPCMRRRQRQQV